MAIDASIYAQQRNPDILGSIGKGMSLGQMIQETNQRNQDIQKQKDIKDAFSAGMTTNPDGTTSFNSGATLSALTKKGYGQEAYELQQQIKTQEAQTQKANMEKMRSQIEMTSQLLGGVKDQATYDFAKQQAQKFGLNVADLPQAYDAKYISQLNQQVLSAKERLDLQFKQDDQSLNREKFDWQKNTDQQKINIDKLKAQSEKEKNKNESSEKLNKLASDLRKERSGLGTTKDTANIAAAYNKIQSAAQNPSAAGDLSLIFGYMKMLDPGSTVREGEFATAQNAAGVPTQLLNVYNRAISGERLSPEQRNDFILQSKGLYDSQMAVQNQVDSQFRTLAEQAGINPNDVLLNFEAKSQQTKSSQKVSPAEANQAFKWAKENPNDPRAREIMKRLGG